MFIKRSPITLIIPCALASAPSFAASLLTFEGLPHNTDVAPTFADFAATSNTGYEVSAGIHGIVGTPNIDIGWIASNHILDSYAAWDGRTTVLQTDFNTAASNTIEISFAPDSPSFGVFITSLDFDLYAGGGPAQVDWAILNGASPIVNGTWTRSDGGRDTINTGMTLAQAEANAGFTLTLRLTRLSGLGSYLAVDNLAFDQVNAVPEPSVAALGAVGLGAMAMRRRRQTA